MDIQLVAHAKDYIDDLAKGINPFTKEEVNEDDIVNHVKISRCLFFVSEVLGEVIANGGTAPKKRERPVPFSPEALDLEQFEFSDDPISLTEVSRRINALKPENMQKLKVTSLSEWLVELHLLETVKNKFARWFSVYFPEYAELYDDLEVKSGTAIYLR